LANAFQVIKETNTEIPDAILPGDDDDDDDDGAIMFTPHPIGGKNKKLSSFRNCFARNKN
jgi:hypothetical protein